MQDRQNEASNMLQTTQHTLSNQIPHLTNIILTKQNRKQQTCWIRKSPNICKYKSLIDQRSSKTFQLNEKEVLQWMRYYIFNNFSKCFGFYFYLSVDLSYNSGCKYLQVSIIITSFTHLFHTSNETDLPSFITDQVNFNCLTLRVVFQSQINH